MQLHFAVFIFNIATTSYYICQASDENLNLENKKNGESSPFFISIHSIHQLYAVTVSEKLFGHRTTAAQRSIAFTRGAAGRTIHAANLRDFSLCVKNNALTGQLFSNQALQIPQGGFVIAENLVPNLSSPSASIMLRVFLHGDLSAIA